MQAAAAAAANASRMRERPAPARRGSEAAAGARAARPPHFWLHSAPPRAERATRASMCLHVCTSEYWRIDYYRMR